MSGGVHTHHGNFYCSLPGGVRAYDGLFRAPALETPATFHLVVKQTIGLRSDSYKQIKDQSLAFVDNNDVTLCKRITICSSTWWDIDNNGIEVI